MRKVFALFLALILCLSMVACGGSNDATKATDVPTEPETTSPINKFVGVYTGNQTYTAKGDYAGTVVYVELEKTMTLYADGTGTIEKRLKESYKDDAIGTVIETCKVTWQDDGTYISITETTTQHKYETSKVGNSFTMTYELKGLQMFCPNESFARWTKKP